MADRRDDGGAFRALALHVPSLSAGGVAAVHVFFLSADALERHDAPARLPG